MAAGSKKTTRRPKPGERGTGYAEAETLFLPNDLLGRARKPEPADLDNMFSLDGWAEAMHSALTWPIRATGWSIAEADEDEGEADLCRRMLGPLMRRVVAGMCSAIGRSYAPAELVWGEREGWLWLEDVAFRPVPQCPLLRDDNGRVTGFKQTAWGLRRPVNEEFLIAEKKAFVYLHDSTASGSAGKSAFEAAHRYFEIKRKLMFYRFKNLERFGGPSVLGRKAGTDEQRRDFAATIGGLRSVGTAVVSPEDGVEVLNPSNPGTAFRQAINDLNFEMAVSTLVQWLALAQEGNSGSYNSSDVQMRLLTNVTEGRIAEMEDAATSLCGAICELNFGPGAAAPTVEAESVAQEPKELMKNAATSVLKSYPPWFQNALATSYARLMGIEKPEGAPDDYYGADEERAEDGRPDAEPKPDEEQDEKEGE